MKYIFVLAFFLIISACKKSGNKVSEVEELFGVKIQQHIDSIFISKQSLDVNYVYPYNVYISFVIDSENYNELMIDLGLVKYVTFQGKDSALCLFEDYKNYAVKPFWTFTPMYSKAMYKKFVNQNTWWRPKLDIKSTFYGGYYSDSVAGHKIVSCKNNRYDGRVISQIDGNKCYILIECYMK